MNHTQSESNEYSRSLLTLCGKPCEDSPCSHGWQEPFPSFQRSLFFIGGEFWQSLRWKLSPGIGMYMGIRTDYRFWATFFLFWNSYYVFQRDDTEMRSNKDGQKTNRIWIIMTEGSQDGFESRDSFHICASASVRKKHTVISKRSCS